jgi:hypothetical protein
MKPASQTTASRAIGPAGSRDRPNFMAMPTGVTKPVEANGSFPCSWSAGPSLVLTTLAKLHRSDLLSSGQHHRWLAENPEYCPTLGRWRC